MFMAFTKASIFKHKTLRSSLENEERVHKPTFLKFSFEILSPVSTAIHALKYFE